MQKMQKCKKHQNKNSPAPAIRQKMQKHKKSRTSKKIKKIKIALSRQLLVLPTCYYIIHLVQYHSVLVDLYAPQNAIMLLCNFAIIPI